MRDSQQPQFPPYDPYEEEGTEPVEQPVYDEEPQKDTGYRCIILAILLEILLGIILFFKSQTAAINYLYAAIPLLLVTAIAGSYAYNHEADMKLFMAVAMLTAIGTALQVLVDQVYTPLTTFSLIKSLIALGIAIVFIFFYALFRRLLNRSFMIYLMMAAAAAVYIVLLLYGTDPNGYGTSAWLPVGNYTIQLTDFAKIFALLFYASLFSSRVSRSDNQVLILSSIFFFINLIGSLLIRELGSFFILFFLHLSVLYIFMHKGKIKRTYLLVVFFSILAALGMCFLLHRMLYASAEAGTLSGLSARIWPIVKKVYERFSVTADITADPTGAGYQLMQGKKALWMAGLFGNTVHFAAIPVAESDMAYIALVNGFGWIFGFAAVLLFLRIMISSSEMSRTLLKKNTQDAVVVYGAGVLLFLQAMIVILGSCNVIPFTGLPIPFLSRGGTYQALTFCLSGLLIHMSERRRMEGGESDEEDLSETETEDGSADRSFPPQNPLG